MESNITPNHSHIHCGCGEASELSDYLNNVMTRHYISREVYTLDQEIKDQEKKNTCGIDLMVHI